MKSGGCNKRSREEIQKIVESFGYNLLSEYMDRNYRRVVLQDSDGYKYNTRLDHLMKEYFPNFVDKSNPFVLKNISLWLEKENKPFILCEHNVYKGSEDKLFFQCLKDSCKEVFDMSWIYIYSSECGCPFCSNHRARKNNNLEYLRQDLIEEWDYERNIKRPEKYGEFSNKRVSWLCSECSHRWDATIANRSNGTGCPKCSDARKESKIANELKKYLIDNYHAKDEHRVFKNPNTGNWLPYDIYIPYGENPSINGFYIEVHWHQHYKVSYFHKLLSKVNGTTPEEEFEYQKYKDKLKKKFAKKHGTYIEIDLRKINNLNDAIEKVKDCLEEIW